MQLRTSLPLLLFPFALSHNFPYALVHNTSSKHLVLAAWLRVNKAFLPK
jgi:hypothetical protein